MGLMFFIFMVGMNLDLKVLKKVGRKALLIAGTGIAVPFIASIGLASLVRSSIGLAKGVKMAPLLIFLGAPVSMSAFSVLVRIMAELKLLSTDVAKLAIPIGALNDMTIWSLLAVGVAIGGGGGGKGGALTPVYVILLAAALVAFMFIVGRRAMGWLARRATREGGAVSDTCVCVTLVAVLASGLCSDAVGVHAVLGPFLLGLVLPKDTDFPQLITHKIEDFVTGLFLPLFFASSGLKTNLGALHGLASLAFLLLFVCTASVGKILASFVTARLIGLPNRRALILGFLLNTKGLAVLIVLNIGKDLKVLTDELFAILVLTALLTSFVTTPSVTALCKGGIGGGEADTKVAGDNGDGISLSSTSGKPSTKSRTYPNRNVASLITGTTSSSQLRILACAYTPHTHSPFMNLLEACRGDKASALKLYPLQLSPLSDRPSSLLMLANHSCGGGDDAAQTDRPSARSCCPPVSISFPASSSLSKVIVRPLSTVSSIDSMYEDICNLAIQKRVALILLPYYKNPSYSPCHTISSMFEELSLNKVVGKVTDHAPCSVGILVERSSVSISPIHPSFFSYKVAVLFCGGPDDREALFVGSRMIGHPGVALRVVRFLLHSHYSIHGSGQVQASNTDSSLPDGMDEEKGLPPPQNDEAKATLDDAKERRLDDEAIAKVKEKASEFSFIYEEHPIVAGQSLIDAVKGFAKEMHEVNMFIVGRGRERPRAESSEEGSELGAVGGLLSSYSGFKFHSCILVVQQHCS
ncbi:hypothetical protein KP509_28G057200 [Ceratopteris richardii]|nr:hypothetical protein KP509_28G057200 [Ceratopteris richardii]